MWCLYMWVSNRRVKCDDGTRLRATWLFHVQAICSGWCWFTWFTDISLKAEKQVKVLVYVHFLGYPHDHCYEYLALHRVLLKKKPMELCSFVSSVAGGLIEYKDKVGRLSLPPPPMPKHLVVKLWKGPSDDMRADCVDHFPVLTTKCQWCKFSG